jgi:hypothetical protein
VQSRGGPLLMLAQTFNTLSFADAGRADIAVHERRQQCSQRRLLILLQKRWKKEEEEEKKHLCNRAVIYFIFFFAINLLTVTVNQ